jgi:hypothetical protein
MLRGTSCSLISMLCSNYHGCLVMCMALQEASKGQKAVTKVRESRR